MNFISVVLLAVVLLGIAIAGMAVKIIFSRSRKFPNTHIGGNKNMMSHGITCAQTWDKMEQKKGREIKVEQLKLSGN
ncbi:hypothetical protein [Roseimarinus sediminis]|jgi:hypothetical protein|uniref:hypothetical protein n=1 Tax=Roseimarinus sediminis TaxID=1610899 RepID=UPI003D1AAC2F